MVFLRVFEKILVEKNCSKYLKPAQGLPRIPSLGLKSLNYKHIQLCKGGYNKPDYFNVCIPALLISQNNKNPG